MNYTRARQIAALYDAAVSAPNNIKVMRAWARFNFETHLHFLQLEMRGYMMILTDSPVTYADLAQLQHDVRIWKQCKVYALDVPQHGLMTERQNQEFRFVHDIIGHALPGNPAGHTGEERAYREHARYYSHEAIKALATETRGQNCALHFGIVGNDASLIECPRFDAPLIFPEQKAFILPDEFRTF